MCVCVCGPTFAEHWQNRKWLQTMLINSKYTAQRNFSAINIFSISGRETLRWSAAQLLTGFHKWPHFHSTAWIIEVLLQLLLFFVAVVGCFG